VRKLTSGENVVLQGQWSLFFDFVLVLGCGPSMGFKAQFEVLIPLYSLFYEIDTSIFVLDLIFGLKI